MSTPSTEAAPQTETKGGKKRKSKPEKTDKARTDLSVGSAGGEGASGAASAEGANDANSKEEDSPFVKDLHKSIRGITKKLNATAKVDSIIAENPGVSLDDLVNDRKINADQKAQAMKKPQLQANLAQLEEQVAQYKKVDQGYQKRLRSEKEALRAAHKTELENVRAEVKQETRAEAEKEAHQNVLVLSKFLRLAAARRHDMDSDPESAERKALEGLLLMVYGGDDAAVEATQKLVTGSDERILSTASEPVDYTYAQVKQAAIGAEEPQQTVEESPKDVEEPFSTPTAAKDEAQHVAQTDPTVANAGLTEISEAAPPVNGATSAAADEEAAHVIPQSSVDDDAANETAEIRWDNKMSASAATAEEWIKVPRDPAETDTGVTATPAALGGTQSWADDQPEAAAAAAAAAAAGAPALAPEPKAGPGDEADRNDGFREVQHSRGGRGRNGPHGENRGGWRGRGGPRGGDGGGWRGRGGGFRGDRGGGEGGGRGRGRGGHRGSRDSFGAGAGSGGPQPSGGTRQQW